MVKLNKSLIPRLQTTFELALSTVFIISKLAFSAVAVAEAKRKKKKKKKKEEKRKFRQESQNGERLF